MALRHQHYPRDLDFESLTLEVEPTDRVGAPLRNRYKARLRGIFLGVVILAGAWPFVAGDPGAHSLVGSATSLFDFVVSNARQIALRAAQERASVPADVSSASLPALPIEQNGGTEFPGALAPIQDANPIAPVSEDSPTGSMGADYTETAEPVEEDPAQSPKRTHAIAAGLGPDLPNVLLTRLSDADLKNAGYAIKTALAKIPDNASFSWPPAPSRREALFQVRFVPGASQGCRRYIVTVTKDRWSSTSAALEKCEDAQTRSVNQTSD